MPPLTPRPLRTVPPLMPVHGLSRAFIALATVDVLLQVALLALVVGGLVSPDLLGSGQILVLSFGGLYAIVSLAQRLLGSVVLVRHGINLRRLGMPGLRLTPWAWVVFWIPFITRPLWVLPYVLLPDSPWVHGVWGVVAIAALLGGLTVHELWRASAPDQIQHWRFVPLSGVVVGWTLGTVLDALVPVVQPFGILATIVLVRRLRDRLRDKRVVVAEVGLLARQASATPDAASDLPLSAGSAP